MCFIRAIFAVWIRVADPCMVNAFAWTATSELSAEVTHIVWCNVIWWTADFIGMISTVKAAVTAPSWWDALRATTLPLTWWAGHWSCQVHTHTRLFYIIHTLDFVFPSQLFNMHHMLVTQSCTGWIFQNESSTSSQWLSINISKEGLRSSLQTAALSHQMLPVVSIFVLLAATSLSYHGTVAATSVVERFLLLAQWPKTVCLTISMIWHWVETSSERH